MDGMKPLAIFFDMDGTLINSEPYWAQSEKVLMERHGLELTDDLPALLQGTSMDNVARVLIDHGLPMSRQEAIQGMIDYMYEREKARMPWLPGAQDFLRLVGQTGIPATLVTGSPRILVQGLVNQSPEGVFTGFVCDESLPDERKKPLPYPYRMGAEILGLDPDDPRTLSSCLVFEDSAPGIRSALAAGLPVVRMEGETTTEAARQAGAFETINSFEGFSLDTMSRLMEKAAGGYLV